MDPLHRKFKKRYIFKSEYYEDSHSHGERNLFSSQNTQRFCAIKT